MDLRAIIQDYLLKAQILDLGTSKDNKPWVTTLYFAVDANLNLYWMSRSSRRHSQELESNPHVSGSILFPAVYGEKVRGLQVQGTAKQLNGEEADAGRNIYTSKYWIFEDRATTKIEGKDEHTCYQLKPSLYILYDEINFPDNPTQQLKI